jgi:hypothetical protein
MNLTVTKQLQLRVGLNLSASSTMPPVSWVREFVLLLNVATIRITADFLKRDQSGSAEAMQGAGTFKRDNALGFSWREFRD